MHNVIGGLETGVIIDKSIPINPPQSKAAKSSILEFIIKIFADLSLNH